MSVAAPGLEHACTIEATLGDPIEMGEGRGGHRRIIPITGGRTSGRITGEVQNIGADWQLVYADGCAFLDTRYAIRTDDGALVEVVNTGFRHGPPEVLAALARGDEVDPASYYMRTSARLETGDDRYRWVNRTVFLGTGRRMENAVRIDLFAVV